MGGVLFREPLLDLIGSAHRNRALGNDDLERVHRLRDNRDRGVHVLQICLAVGALGRTDGDKNNIRAPNGPRNVGGK